MTEKRRREEHLKGRENGLIKVMVRRSLINETRINKSRNKKEEVSKRRVLEEILQKKKKSGNCYMDCWGKLKLKEIRM